MAAKTTNRFEPFGREMRFALRALIKKPAFACLTITSLSLAIGVTTALFTVFDTVILKPLPFRDSDRLVAVWQNDPQDPAYIGQTPTSIPTFQAWREQSRAVSELAGTLRRPTTVVVNGAPETVTGGVVSSGLFPMLGVRPIVGRVFSDEDDHPGAQRVAIVSERLWRTRLGGDRTVEGRAIRADAALFTIIGVVADIDVPGLGRPEVWFPLSVGVGSHSHAGHAAHGSQASAFTDRTQRILTVLGRLSPNTSPSDAETELSGIAARDNGVTVTSKPDQRVVVIPVHQQIVHRMRDQLSVLLLAVGLVFLIACANVANLLTARLIARRQDIGVRIALGCSRARILWQMFVENLMLSLAAAASGWLLSAWMLATLVRVSPLRLPRKYDVHLNGDALIFTVGLSVLAALLFGLLPMFFAIKTDPRDWLKSTDRGRMGEDRRQRALRHVLIGAEIALCATLLIGVGLAVRSFWALSSIQIGFSAQRVVVARVDPPVGATTSAQLALFYDDVIRRLAAVPGVEAVGLTGDLPLHTSWWTTAFTIANRPFPPDRVIAVNYARVAGDYFGAMRIMLKQGRLFSPSDDGGARKVAIVNDAFARRFFPNEDAIGSHLAISGTEPPYAIVGIVASTIQRSVSAVAPSLFYVPYAQNPRGSMTLTLRSSIEPAAIATSIAREVGAISPLARVSQAGTMSRLLEDALAPQRYLALLVSFAGGVALFLVIVGVYGVTTHVVARRTAEIGMRMTLGATPMSAISLVLSESMRVAFAGIALGIAGALALSGAMRGMLYGVAVTDRVTFTAVPLILLTVSAFAAYIPARRASRLDPLVALRCE